MDEMSVDRSEVTVSPVSLGSASVTSSSSLVLPLSLSIVCWRKSFKEAAMYDDLRNPI